ncbi:MAG: hypothetical protein FWF15_07990 [Oscillospiraceae bacterium]|nr:hypothetical protein [Oscillospiraceae bacterium]
MKKISIILILLILVSVVVAACSEKNDSGTGTVPLSTENAEMEDDGPARLRVKDSLPADLNYNGASFRMFSSGESQNQYIQGPEEQSGDIVYDTVIERNQIVEDRLNVKFEYFVPTLTWDQVSGELRKVVMSGDDAYELLIAGQYGACLVASEGLFINVLEGKYFDFEQPWWNTNYMNELAIGKNKIFFLVGDYFIDMLRGTKLLYFNKNLWENYFGGDDLYQIVFDGKWTIETMTNYVRQSYHDINGNGMSDPDDIFGIVCYATYSSTDGFAFATDIEYIQRDADGLISLAINNEKSIKFAEMLVNLFYCEGFYIYPISGDANDFPHFKSGRSLFYPGTFSTTNGLRDMENDYGMIPNPKYDEAQTNYRSVVHDTMNFGIVPITTSASKFEMTSAVVEALCAESYRRVVPAYYETALKVKYVRDEASSQMIDLIHESMMTNFIFAYYSSLNNAGFVFRALVTGKSTDFASEYAKIEKGALTGLEKLQAAYLD